VRKKARKKERKKSGKEKRERKERKQIEVFIILTEMDMACTLTNKPTTR
jgi:hypothetical protein